MVQVLDVAAIMPSKYIRLLAVDQVSHCLDPAWTCDGCQSSVLSLLNNLEHAPSAIKQQPGDLDDLETYGLGTSRSIEDYFNYAGINFKDKTISDKAKAGIFPAN